MYIKIIGTIIDLYWKWIIMAFKERKKLGDALYEAGKITKQQLDTVIKEQKKTGKRIGEILTDLGFVTEEEVLEALEKQLDIPRVSIEGLAVNMDAVKSISENIANKYTLFPIGYSGEKILVAMTDPLNFFALDDVRMSSGKEVEPLLGSKEDIKKAIGKYYSTQLVKKAADELSREQEASGDNDDDQEEDAEVKSAPAVKLVESIIINAIKSKASDIHIEPFEKYVKIRYRIDGELQEVLRPGKDTQGALITRIKILSNMNIAERRIPQDGRILMRLEDKDVDLRVSVLPTVFGEKVVIRVLSREGNLIGKDKLGFPPDELEKLENITSSPYGIFLVTGPTGSGKSTTLYTFLSDVNKPDVNIITVEDPVEFLLEGINQVNVNPKAGLTFAAGLRSILRQDPDIIMIGEIRDGETAEIAVRAAITGHLVMSTIHTNDAPSAIVRLVDMGIEPYLVASSLCGVMSQRLVRKICTHCKKAYLADPFEKKMLGLEDQENVTIFKGEGCTFCNGSGYSGRTGVYEVMEITREIREMIISGKSTDEIRDVSIANGMKTLKMASTELVLRGITTIEEMIKIAFLKE